LENSTTETSIRILNSNVTPKHVVHLGIKSIV